MAKTPERVKEGEKKKELSPRKKGEIIPIVLENTLCP